MGIEKITIPDFGDVQEITVVEIFVGPGDSVEKEDSLIALESEKAVMDIPSPLAGTITEVLVKENDQVKSGDVIAMIEVVGADTEAESPEASDVQVKQTAESVETDEEPGTGEPELVGEDTEIPSHATPSVRALARKLGIDLKRVKGTGPNGRILKEDLERVSSQVTGTAMAAAAPRSLVGTETSQTSAELEIVELGRIQKISGPRLPESWVSIPHVTHFDEADISEMERFRKELNGRKKEDEPGYSPLVFVIKALAATLKEFPTFNSSLHEDGKRLILKKNIHLGVAVDTSGGLVVPVVKDADRRGLKNIATELARLSSGARAGKLGIPDIQGATFTISSLGGIGGTGFTPIVNSPQVGILGLSRSYMKPVWDGQQFVPTLTLPFSVSYDHRVIDGAEAARFCRALAGNIEDLKRTLV